MPNHPLAEALLSLFTTPSRASSIAGDLTEDAHRRGSFWFWRQVTQTTLSLCFRQITSAPVRLAVLFVFGNLIIEATTIFLTPLLVVFTAWNGGTPDPTTSIATSLFFGRLIAPFLTGLLLARLSEGREIAICGALAITRQSLLLGTWGWFSTHEIPLISTTIFSNSLIAISLLFAGVLVRRHNLTAQSQSPDSAHSESRQSPNR